MPTEGLSDEDLDRLEALARQAHAGPWKVEVRDEEGYDIVTLRATGAKDGTWQDNHSHEVAEKVHHDFNAHFMAAAHPGAVLDLIAAVRR